MPFRIVCTDIDGTLLDSRRELSQLTLDTFRRLPEEVLVVLASSRMPSAMTHLQRELNITGKPLICYNGGYVLQYTEDQQSPEVIYSTFIPVAVCEEIVGMTRGTSIHVSLYFEDEWTAPTWDYWAEREARVTKVSPEIRTNADVLGDWRRRNVGGHKVMCMGPENEIQEMEQRLNEKLAKEIYIYRSRPTYLELAPRAISKGSALQLLLEKKLNATSDDVIAFGDNYNDIELLKIAGRGIAVANAIDQLKEVADEVTINSKDDGVAIALRKHFSIQ